MAHPSHPLRIHSRPRRGGVSLTTAAVAALVLSACGGAVQQEADQENGSDDGPFTIGLIAPITGPVVPEATALQRGFELAVERINESGGVLGQDGEFVMVDDEATVSRSTQLAQRLINDDHVDFIFGTIPGDTAAAVAAVAEEAGVPFATAIMGNAPYCGDLFFSFGEPDLTMLEPLVPRMLEDHGSTVALVGNDYVFPREYNASARSLIEDAGGEVVMEEYSPLGTADWQPIVQSIVQSDPDWVLSAVVGGDAVTLVTQLDQAGALDDRGISGISLIQEFFPSLHERTEGSVLSGRYSDVLDNEANAEFVSAYRETYDFDDPIPSVGANTYEGVQAIARAVEEAGTTEGSAVAAALAGTTVEDGVFGSGYFTDSHQFVTDMYLFEIRAEGYVPIEEFDAMDDLPANPVCS
jgi:branched-chain amino acid transport system substrate-binding protein/urea transport system substrate-binding protein